MLISFVSQACTYCRKSGATLGCDVTRCKVAFHLPCGIENNSLHQFFNSFKWVSLYLVSEVLILFENCESVVEFARILNICCWIGKIICFAQVEHMIYVSKVKNPD